VTDPGSALCIPILVAPSTTGATLTKSIDGVVNNGDGTYTISYAYTTTRADGTYAVRDCAFTDANDSGTYDVAGEPVIGTTIDNAVTITNGAGSSSITVPATSGDVVCDRLAVTGTVPPSLDLSNVACIELSEDALPAGAIGGVGLLALLTGVFAVAYLRNRKSIRLSTARKH